MFIQTEETPNPLSMKFIPGKDVTGGAPISFSSRNAEINSPLAKKLFELEYIESVFLGSDFITITKNEHADWYIIKPEILVTIMEFFISGKPVIGTAVSKDTSVVEDSDIVKQIKEIIETRVRPSVEQDGGDITFHSFENGIVKLELHGACSGCPSSTVTLKDGIENLLKHFIPEVQSVEAVEE